MAAISITVPDQVVNRVITALCVQAGTSPSAANAKAQIIQLVKQVVKTYESQQASQTAQLAASQDVDNNILLS